MYVESLISESTWVYNFKLELRSTKDFVASKVSCS